MNKRLGILAVLIVILVGVVLLLNASRPALAPTLEVGFLGFTNSGGAIEARFAISNPPNSAVTLHSVTLKETRLGSAHMNKGRGYFSGARREEWGLDYAIIVETTNEPLRVVFEFQQPAVGPRRMLERLKEFWAKLQGTERTFFTGIKFFVTNETRVANPAH